jgi:hypothetical protein
VVSPPTPRGLYTVKGATPPNYNFFFGCEVSFAALGNVFTLESSVILDIFLKCSTISLEVLYKNLSEVSLCFFVIFVPSLAE